MSKQTDLIRRVRNAARTNTNGHVFKSSKGRTYTPQVNVTGNGVAHTVCISCERSLIGYPNGEIGGSAHASMCGD